MQFRVTGKSRQTQRRRNRVYQARSEAEARALGEADGISVDVVEEVPPEPATGPQLELAAKLGLAVPAGASKDDLHDLLDAQQQDDNAASEQLRALAQGYGLFVTRYVGKKKLFLLIFNQLLGRNDELAGWFTYRVYRELVHGSPDAAIKSPHDRTIKSIAGEILLVPGVLDSILRYRGQDLVWFGEWTSAGGMVRTGGSNRTIAYKEAAHRLRPVVASEAAKDASRRETPERTYTPRGESAAPAASAPPAAPAKKGAGCLTVVAGFAVFTLALAGAINSLRI